MKYALVLGAGMTGLSAGFRLARAGWRVEVWEKTPVIGGMARTFAEGAWKLDLGPHKVYSPHAKVMADLYQALPESRFLTVEKRSQIRLRDRFVRYPVGLRGLLSLSPLLFLRCGLSYAAAVARGPLNRSEERSYQEFLVRRYGHATYQLVFAPYARKIWGPPESLSKQIAESRVVAPSLLAMLRQMLLGQPRDKVLSVESFKYPRQGSGEICEALAEGIRERGSAIETGVALEEVELPGGRLQVVRGEGGQERRLDHGDALISTIPLASLLSCLRPEPSPEVQAAARSLRTRRLVLLYLELAKPRLTGDNWIFFPEAKYRWNRAFEQKNFSQEMGPPDRTCLCLEITCDDSDPLWRGDADDAYRATLPQLEESGLVARPDVIRYFIHRIRDAYPVYDLEFASNLGLTLDRLAEVDGLYSVGRQGSFTYGGMLDCLEMGYRTADHICSDGDRPQWRALQEEFQKVEVVD